MTTERRVLARSIVAKGDAIKKLRLEAKQTQKELVRGSAVPLRTYQRAEQGKAISPETLREIARLLKVSFEAVVKNDAESDTGQIRLYRCAAKGGLQIMNLIQGRPGDVTYSFNLDPGPVEAEKIAVVVDFCKAHTTAGCPTIPGVKIDESVPYFGAGSPSFIRAVGQLNEKLGQLVEAGVNVFVGSYFYFNVALEAIDWHVEDEEYVQRPQIHQRVLIAFSERGDDFILKPGPQEWEREHSCYERAAKWNFKHERHPDIVDERVGFFGPDDFLVFNREYWVQQKSELSLKAVAAPGRPNIATLLPRRLRQDHEG